MRTMNDFTPTDAVNFASIEEIDIENKDELKMSKRHRRTDPESKLSRSVL
jgi:hypothetical protein